MEEVWDVLDENGKPTGRTIIRGNRLSSGDYHLVSEIWPINDRGELLIQRRSIKKKGYPGLWAPTGGSALQGEDSLTAALRELEEEVGIRADANQLMLAFETKRNHNSIIHVWIMDSNVDSRSLVLQQEEVCDAKWVTWEEIDSLKKRKLFVDFGEDYFSRLKAFMEQQLRSQTQP